MKKTFLFMFAAALACAPLLSATNGDDTKSEAGQEARKKIFMQVGAVEKVENDRYIMRKTETRYEFYVSDEAAVFLREEASADDAAEKVFLVIKGPKNRKTILANSVYIYRDLKEYREFEGKKEGAPDEDAERIFSSGVSGSVKQKEPLVIETEGGVEYIVSFDEDTYWVLTLKADKSEIKPGERIKLFFDKLYSIRYKNYPVKIVIDRIKVGY